MISMTLIFLWWSEWSEKAFMKFGSVINLSQVHWRSKTCTQQLEWPALVIIESCVTWILSVSRPLNFFWVILIDNSWWIVWAQFNGSCLIHSFDSATLTAMGNSKELGADVNNYIIDSNESGKSLGAVSKRFQVPKSTEQTFVSKYEVLGTVVIRKKMQTATCCWEETCQDGQEETRNNWKVRLWWIRNCWKTRVSVHSEPCFCIATLQLDWSLPLLRKKNTSGGIEVRSLTSRAPYLLSGTVVLVLCCVLLPVDLLL